MTETVHLLRKSQRAGEGENRHEYQIMEDHSRVAVRNMIRVCAGSSRMGSRRDLQII